MKQLVFLSLLLVANFHAFAQWTKVESKECEGLKTKVYFYDHFLVNEKKYKGTYNLHDAENVERIQKIHYSKPCYVVEVANPDKSYAYYIMRGDSSRANQDNFFDLDYVVSQKQIKVKKLEDRSSYQTLLRRTDVLENCKGGLIYENLDFIQINPGKSNIINKGIPYMRGKYTRVRTYEEIITPVFDVIKGDLKK